MKKRLFSLFLIFALALSLCAAAHAEVSRVVFDEDGTIGAEDERILEELGARIQADTGVSVCVYIARDRGESDPAAFAERFYSENIGADDGVSRTRPTSSPTTRSEKSLTGSAKRT